MKVKGIGFFGLLTILFIGLKLTNVIDWPWISPWILEPSVFWAVVLGVWGFVGIGLGILLFYLVVAIIRVSQDAMIRRRVAKKRASKFAQGNGK